MIISISGPSSTGKTTLFNALKINLNDFYTKTNDIKNIFIEEDFRRYVKNRQISLDDPEIAFNFQYDLLNNSIELVPKIGSNFILDRCAYDTLVYGTLHFLRLENKEKYINKYIEYTIECNELLKNIKYIFLTQVKTDKIENDNIRPIIYEKLRLQEINLFNTLYKNLNIKTIHLPLNLNDQLNINKSYLYT